MLSIAMKFAVRRVADWPRAKPISFLSVLVLCAVPALYGQQKTETPQQTNEKIQELAAQERVKPHDVPVGTGDLLHIEVFDVPELSRDVRVGDAGDISYPLIPAKITAAGLTPFQLEQKMEQLLIENGLVTHPQVSVFVKEQNSQPVSVVGAVMKPMVYQVIRPTTLLEILAGAGGISDDAGSVVIVTRSPTIPAARSAAAIIGASANGNGSVKAMRVALPRTIRSDKIRKSLRFACRTCWNPAIQPTTFWSTAATWSRCRARASSMSQARESRNPAATCCKAMASRLPSSRRWRWPTE